jgi:hypothetical protein
MNGECWVEFDFGEWQGPPRGDALIATLVLHEPDWCSHSPAEELAMWDRVFGKANWQE